MSTMDKSYMESTYFKEINSSFKAGGISNTAIEAQINPFELSEEQIRKKIYETHACSDDSFDADSLFIIVANILKRSCQIVDEVIQEDIKVGLDNIVEINNPKSGFNVPMCILKKIGCELLSCKAPVAEMAHETTLAIFEKLRYYSWEAKAVLTLAAFAKEFGDLLHLVQLDQTNNHDQLTKSLALLKGSCILPNTPEFRHKRKIVVGELNNLIKATLKVMETIFELQKLSVYGPHSIAELPIALNSYWVVITVIACANKVTILTSEHDSPHDLSPYDTKIHNILSILSAQLAQFRLMKEEEYHYYKLLKLSKTSDEVMEFLKLLFFSQDSHHFHLIDGSNNYQSVEINVLKKKKALLVIFRPDMLESDINILRRIYCEKIKKYNTEKEYAIVWVPIIDETFSYEHRTIKYEYKSWLRSKEIQWYSVSKLVSHKAGLRFLREEWNFETNPVAVVLNVARGIVENKNAMHTIRLWGLDAFPFDHETERRIFSEMNWLYTFFADFPHQYGKLTNWVKKEKYVIFHGGMDKEWTEEIDEKISFMSKDLNIKIKRFNIEERVEVKNKFWGGIDSLMLTKFHKEEYYFAKQQVKRLSSYKHTQGWFALNKGPTTVVVGSRATFSKAVAEFDMWKVSVRQRTFEVAFKEYHEKLCKSLNSTHELSSIACCSSMRATTIQKSFGNCCTIESVLTATGEYPEKISCPVCDQVMEITVTYKCNHTSKDDFHC
ncbi:hypothetical protein G4B88_003666 [Cannabis sativa]|uniref:Protein SIEVE ELEMENT OCCLUSION B n=1 Tax=Cannabis sativa TaxID=3483 RepID=A0A7J6E5D3_CANSA|nr:hypothetical protein G4B88_003666 [Cannabis sativa]